MEASNARLKSALQATRLDRLTQRFLDEGIGDDILDQLQEPDLEKLGVSRMGDRKRLLSIFQKMFIEGSGGAVLLEVQGGPMPADSELRGTAVKTFLIGKFPVLQEDWEWVRVWGICNGYDIGPGQANGSFAPVTHVSWYDAVKWCNAKSEHEGLQPVYLCEKETYRQGEFGPSGSKLIQRSAEAGGYRLPTEAEWEWAAIGGILGQHQAAGIPLPESALPNSPPPWHIPRSIGFNELGIYNMTSNVWEWCWDHDDSQTAHRIRGGMHFESGEKNASRLRISRSPDSRLGVLGFRLARNA